MEKAQSKPATLVRQARELCRAHYSQRLGTVRTRIQETSREVSAFVEQEAAKVKNAKDNLLKEAQKLGINLEAQGAK